MLSNVITTAVAGIVGWLIGVYVLADATVYVLDLGEAAIDVGIEVPSAVVGYATQFVGLVIVLSLVSFTYLVHKQM